MSLLACFYAAVIKLKASLCLIAGCQFNKEVISTNIFSCIAFSVGPPLMLTSHIVCHEIILKMEYFCHLKNLNIVFH